MPSSTKTFDSFSLHTCLTYLRNCIASRELLPWVTLTAMSGSSSRPTAAQRYRYSFPLLIIFSSTAMHVRSFFYHCMRKQFFSFRYPFPHCLITHAQKQPSFLYERPPWYNNIPIARSSLVFHSLQKIILYPFYYLLQHVQSLPLPIYNYGCIFYIFSKPIKLREPPIDCVISLQCNPVIGLFNSINLASY